MSGAAFLLIAVVIAVVGSLIVWFRHRTPKHVESSVDAFRREMDALSKPPTPTQPPRPVRPLDRRGGGR